MSDKMSKDEQLKYLAYCVTLLAVRCWEQVGHGPGSYGAEIIGICDAIRGLETSDAQRFNSQKAKATETNDRSSASEDK